MMPDRSVIGNYLDLSNEQLDALLSEYSQADVPGFLETSALRSNLEYCRVPEEHHAMVLETAQEISDNSSLSALCRHCYHVLYNTDCRVDDWPSNQESNLKLGLIYLIIGAAMAPIVRAKHAESGIPAEITRDTCRQIACFCGNHVYGFGAPGIIKTQLFWLRNYTLGRLYRLGRMEYMLAEYHRTGPIFRHRENGWKLAFAKDSATYTSDGCVLLNEAAEGSWQASFQETDAAVSGHVLNPDGHALRQKVAIDKDVWECILKPGDLTIDLHIPAGGGMDQDACLNSFQQAFSFFDTYFGKKLNNISCSSWIFNTQLEEPLPNSNLVKLMQQLYLSPTVTSGKDGFFFVFCKDYDDLSKAPRDTSLQRAMLDILESGEGLRSANMVIFEEELKRFGDMPYRKTWDQIAPAIGLG